MNGKTVFLNVGAFVRKSFVNGPGARAVIWFQGCRKRCLGCANPQFLEEKPKKVVSPVELANEILAIPDIEGVTYSGGEPFLQAEGLCVLSGILKKHGKSIVCYTGYTYEEIMNSESIHAHELLRYLDILIDGEFVREQRKPLLWRSSTNQKVYFLSEKYKNLSSKIEQSWEGFELHISNGEIILTGFIDEIIEKKILEELKSKDKLSLISNYA